MNSHSACKSGRASRLYDWICGKHKHNFPQKKVFSQFSNSEFFRRDSCLLNLNGNNLVGNLVSIPGVTGGGAGGGGGILGGLLGGK